MGTWTAVLSGVVSADWNRRVYHCSGTGMLFDRVAAALQALVVAFRQVFVDAVKPIALPSTWDVHHDAPREFGPNSIFQAEVQSLMTSPAERG